MPLPNMSSSGVTPSQTYTPNTAALQQMGANVNQVKKLQDQNQAISKVLDNISARLGNVTNIRTGMQSASFEAFGNNFLTRGMNQIASGISDSIASLFKKDEEEAEDPVLKAIKAQTSVITEQGHANATASKNIALLLTEQNKTSTLLLGLAKHPRANEQLAKDGEKQRGILSKQETTLKDILKSLTDRGIITRTPKPKSSGDTNTIEADTGELQTPEEAEAIKARKRKYRTFKGNRTAVPESGVDKTAKTTDEAQNEPKKTKSYTAGNDIFAVFGPIGEDIKTSKAILQNILEVQKACNASLDKMTKADEKERFSPAAIAAETPEAAVATPAERTGFWKGARSFWMQPRKSKQDIVGAAAGGNAFNATAQGIANSIAPSEEEPKPDEKGGFGLGDVAGMAVAGGKHALKFASRAAKFIKGAALPMAIAAGTGILADSVMGDMGVGKDAQGNELQVDAQQDNSNWEKMSWSQKFESGAARGVEKIGGFFGFDNLSKQAQADRIKRETEYLAGKDAQDNISAITDSQKALAKSKETTQSSAAPMLNNTNVVNNQTILPSRAIVKNTDDSYNRYVNTILR